ncbi:MAG: hypothetical protein EPN93_15995 [Spirochaetes bacterium]|nr:MAG: hypothetical protein EPN93_15995 [Spirochaetota bacterium]
MRKKLRSKIKRWSRLVGGLCAISLILAFPSIGIGRDINLDALYIKKSSVDLARIIQLKLDMYAAIGATEVDTGVIFAGWISGDALGYVKEIPDSSQNLIVVHTLSTGKKTEVARIKGTVAAARCATGGFMVVKRLDTGTRGIPASEMLVVDLKTGKTTSFPSEFPFMDFDIPREENSVVFETSRGMEEFFPATGVRKVLLEKKRYSEISSPAGPIIPLTSPGRGAMLLMSGGGGGYDALLVQNGTRTAIKGITSAAEIAWLGPQSLVFRTGAAGRYGVIMLSLDGMKSTSILESSLNANVMYSHYAGIISMQMDGMACMYVTGERKFSTLGIEAEDILFDPVGAQFVGLFNKKLYVVPLQNAQKRQIELARTWENIRQAYEKCRENRSVHANDYSLDYLTRKINLYSLLLKGSR